MSQEPGKVELSNKKKKFIKRNQGKMTPQEMASHLRVPAREVGKVLGEATPGAGPNPAPTPPWLRESLFILLAACAALAPFVIRNGLFDFADLPQRVFIQAATLFLAFLAAGRMWRRKGSALALPLVFLTPLLGFLGWAGLSFLWAPNTHEAWESVGHWLAACLFFVTAFQIMDKPKHGERLLGALFFSGFVVALVGIGQHLKMVDWIPQAVPPASTFANRNMAVHYIILTLPLGAAFFLRTRSGPFAWVFAFASALMLDYLFFTSNRNGWICLMFQAVLAGLLFLALWKGKGFRLDLTREKIAALAASLLVFLVLFNLTPQGFSWQFGKVYDRLGTAAKQALESVAQEKATTREGEAPQPDAAAKQNVAQEGVQKKKAADTSLELRMDIWKNSLAMVKEHPFTGVGVGNHKVLYPIYARKAVVEKVFSEDFQLTHVHNDYIQTAAELGLTGMAFLAWLAVAVLLVLKRLFASGDRRAVLLAAGMAVGLAGLALNAMASFPFQRAIPPFAAAAFLAVIARQYGQMRPKSVLSLKAPPLAAGLAALMFLTLLAATLWSGFRSMEADRHFKELSFVESAGQWDRVIAEGRKVLEYEPGRIKTYSYIGRAHLEKGRNKEAIQALEKAIAAYPYHMNALLNLGVAYATDGRLEKALEVYDKVLAIKPDYQKVHNNLGNIHMQQNRPEKALEAFGRAAAFDPENPIVWLNMGIAANAIKNFPKAAECFKKAAQLKPDWIRANRSAGMVLFHHLGDKEEGAKYLIRAQQLEDAEKKAQPPRTARPPAPAGPGLAPDMQPRTPE